MAKAPNGIVYLDDLLKCTVCVEPFTNPKMLQCEHTCQECLQDVYNVSRQTGRISCPTCREATPIPPSGIAGLRNDVKVNQLTEVHLQVSNRRSTDTCNMCTFRDRKVIAKVFCVNCNVGYCEDCLRVHSANPVFKDHNVVSSSTELFAASTELACGVRWSYYLSSLSSSLSTFLGSVHLIQLFIFCSTV